MTQLHVTEKGENWEGNPERASSFNWSKCWMVA